MPSGTKNPSTPLRMTDRVTRNCLIAAGFISLTSQLVIFREFLNVFDGNELLIGLLLFTWMTFTAIGSFAGLRFVRIKNTAQITGFLLLLAGILPVVSVAFLYYLKSVFLPPGVSGGFTTVLFFAAILLFPVCVVNGMLFSIQTFLNSVNRGKNQTALAYAYDTLGSVTAGLLFTAVLSYMLSVMQILFLLTSVTFIIYTLLFSATFYNKLIIGILAAILLAAGFSGFPDKFLRSIQFPDQKILYSKDSPYGNVCVTGNSGQLNIFSNGVLFYNTNDDPVHEESVHFALLQHPNPVNVLVVSGGVNGALKQVRKYNTVRHLDYAEVNPWLIKAENILMPVKDTNIIHILNTDACFHIKQCTNKYDAIILILPEPVNAQLNRYYTLEFFKEAREALKPGGIIETALGATLNYVSDEATALNASVFHTLKLVFRHVELVVSQKNYYLASDNAISFSVDSLLALRPLMNDYVNPFYFDDELTSQRSKMVIEDLNSGQISVNRDIHPVTYVFQIREWLTKSGFHFEAKIMLIVVFVLIVIVTFIFTRNFTCPSFTVISSAFAGASSEFLLLIIVQVLFGQIYRMIGILFGCYMAGLSAGTFIAGRLHTHNSRKSVLRLQVILLALVLLLPILIYFKPASGMSLLIVMSFIMLYTILIAFVAGFLFGRSVVMNENPSTPLRAANNLYGIDLVASATGTLLTSLLLFPVAGIWITTGFSAAVLLVSFACNSRKGLI